MGSYNAALIYIYSVKYCGRKRKKSIPYFQRFINIAQGSAVELRTQVYISQEVNIFSDLDAKELIQELKAISKMLQSLHSSLKKL
jgi:four helix bundle protein